MKRYDRVTIGLFLVLIFGFSIAFWVLPDKDFSPEENRVLQGTPALSLDRWADGTVSRELTEYVSDQFPLRSMWLGLHAVGELALGRGEVNGVLLGSDGRLAVRRLDMYLNRSARAEDTDLFRVAHITASLDALVDLHTALSDEGIALTVLLPPRTIDVAAEDFAYPSDLSDDLDDTIRTRLEGIAYVDLLADFRARHAAGEAVYFRTDHHWTQRGAYVAYAAVMEAMGMAAETLPSDFFTYRTIPHFYGTSHARAGIPLVPPDTLEIFEARDGSDAHFTVRDARGEAVLESGFISEKYLSEKDKYGAFLDGTHRFLTVTDKTLPVGTRPRLLLLRDSFGAAMVPFLARHFDIVTVNIAMGSLGANSVTELAQTHGCTRVLVVCNRENLLTSDLLVRLSPTGR